ncbi:DUF1427 family protein [Bacillus sp. FJAT-50079]|uniref:XapX domain-containing protein n=1 Tax=Bacillus sp. FJAT-50079 TaxID=2833577 RepID=UPI001BC93F38|nr:DUF1427 family protein [Bacillus sp. FJAT-50079]MBS4208253.1 DUF1427 family protein [Bacillus sp. FJAT-50079]
MMQIILALIAGVFVGLLFAVVKLPIPAPPALSGIVGILGIFLGHQIYLWVLPMVKQIQ